MLSRKQLFYSVREYLFSLGFRLELNEQSQDNITFDIYEKHTSKLFRSNQSLDDIAKYISLRVPESFMCGYHQDNGNDNEIFADILKTADQERRITQAIEKIERLCGLLS